MAGWTKLERAARFAAELTAAAMDAQRASDPRLATRNAALAALRRYYRADKVGTLDRLLPTIGSTFMNVPFAGRFLMREVITDAIVEWLPEGHPLRMTTIVAFPLVESELNAALQDPAATADSIVAAIKTKFTETFNHPPGGPVADPAPTPAPSPAPPLTRHYIEKLTKIAAPQRQIYRRIAEFGEREARPGVDVHREISGVAGLLRDAVASSVDANASEAMNELIANWGDVELARLGGMTGPNYTITPAVFLSDVKVQTLMADLIQDHYGRKGAPLPSAMTDMIDGFFDGQGVPPALRGPLRRLLQPGGVENAVDGVENVVFPAAHNALRGGFSLPLGGAAAILGVAAVCTLAVQVIALNEYTVAATLSGFEVMRRGLGFVLYAAYVLCVPALFFGLAVFVAWPFEARPVRPAEPAAPVAPNEADFGPPWYVPQNEGETDTDYERRLGALERAWDPDEVAAFNAVAAEQIEAFDRAEAQHAVAMAAFARAREARRIAVAEFEVLDDEWRARYRSFLVERAGVVFVSIVIVPALVAVAGMVVQIASFQWLTMITFVVIGVIAFHILWLGDDIVNVVRKYGVDKGEEQGEHGHIAAAVKHKADVTEVTRIRKITGTLTIIVTVAALTDAVAIQLAPWWWAVGTLAVTFLTVGLSLFLVSRILFGNSVDAPADIRPDSANQRKFIHKTVAALLGFGGVVFLAVSLGLSVGLNGWGWYKACKGFEETHQCSVIHNGYGQYVDSVERWEALRDRSARELARANRPVGDACVIATTEVDAMSRAYSESLYGNADGATAGSMCSDMELHKEEWSDPALRPAVRACATLKSACAKAVKKPKG